ncbi:MAG: carbohydrate ABC transporter permease [Spirochaetia bacterium]
MAGRMTRFLPRFFLYLVLILYAFSILYPIAIMALTSLKQNKEIFKNPYGLPKVLSLSNYVALASHSHYVTYFRNSIVVTALSLLIIVLVGSLASFVLAKFTFFLHKFVYLYLIAGLMIPIRLGTINILVLSLKLGIFDNLISLILVNIASGIPFAVLVLTGFFREVPDEIVNSSRIDGCSEPQIFSLIVLPLAKPAVLAVAIVYFIPIWNDFWFPLILIRSDAMKTVPLATALLFGQYQTNFGLVFATLTLASLPVILFYLILSRQFTKGITAGALIG